MTQYMSNDVRGARAMLQASREAGAGLFAPLEQRSIHDEAVHDPERYQRRVKAASAMLANGEGRALLAMVRDALGTVARERVRCTS